MNIILFHFSLLFRYSATSSQTRWSTRGSEAEPEREFIQSASSDNLKTSRNQAKAKNKTLCLTGLFRSSISTSGSDVGPAYTLWLARFLLKWLKMLQKKSMNKKKRMKLNTFFKKKKKQWWMIEVKNKYVTFQCSIFSSNFQILFLCTLSSYTHLLYDCICSRVTETTANQTKPKKETKSRREASQYVIKWIFADGK